MIEIQGTAPWQYVSQASQQTPSWALVMQLLRTQIADIDEKVQKVQLPQVS